MRQTAAYLSGRESLVIEYGPRDAASVLMATGHAVSLREPRGGERAVMLRMTDGTMRRMTWVVDDQPMSQRQLDYFAARASSAARAESLLAQPLRVTR